MGRTRQTDCRLTAPREPARMMEMMMAKIRTYGFDVYAMTENLSMDDLLALQESVMNNPDNRNPDHAAGRSIYLYTKSTRRKLDAIAWAITHKLKDKQSA